MTKPELFTMDELKDGLSAEQRADTIGMAGLAVGEWLAMIATRTRILDRSAIERRIDRPHDVLTLLDKIVHRVTRIGYRVNGEAVEVPNEVAIVRDAMDDEMWGDEAMTAHQGILRSYWWLLG